MCVRACVRVCVCACVRVSESVLKYPAHFPTSPHLDDTALDSITCCVTSWSVRGRLREHPAAAKYVFLCFCFDPCTCLCLYGNGREGCCVSGDAAPSQHDVAVSMVFQSMSALIVAFFYYSSPLVSLFYLVLPHLFLVLIT